MSSIELLTIGTELLLGFTVDTNGAEIGRSLAAAGIPVVRRTTVSDDPDAIREAARQALARTGALLATGGLGPTADDVTKRVVAELFGVPLEYRPELWEGLVARFARYGRVPAERNRCQAEVPQGAIVLSNRWGTAPGLWLEGKPGIAILLPGVPSEMRALLQHEVLPRLAGRAGGRVVRSRTVRTTAVPESTLAERLGGIEARMAPLSLAYLPGVEGVDLRLTAWHLPPDEADLRLGEGVKELQRLAGGWVYGEGEDDLAAVLLQRARAGSLRLATAESCTGGAVGMRLTAIPGSSDVFLGGVVAYDNRIKIEHLGVEPSLIEREGAVSESVALAMVRGAARAFRSDLAIAVTGIAGPGGGSREKPVGLVYLATLIPGATEVTRHVLPGDRAEIRARASQLALFRLLQALTRSAESPAPPM
jgi:nicotinamide-nucleotide amidase